MKITSPLLGSISYSEDSVVIFPEGLIGLENCTRFVIKEIQEYKPFEWLLCLDNPSLVFPIMAPQLFMPDYHIGLSINLLRSIGITSIDQSAVYTIVTIGKSMEDVTANLRGPIVINKVGKIGKQFILSNSTFPLRHRIITNPQ